MAPKGLILVGGLGTQLRPLTLSRAKALIDFGNKPLLLHLIESLVRAGVTEIILAINYRTEIMKPFVEQYQDQYGITIHCSEEEEPLGTAGPIALAKSRGLLDDHEPFFVMNCDIACDFNLRALLDFHKSRGKVGTIMVTRVDEPAKYGKSVVVAHETGLIERFVEHGRTFAGNLINAGVYVFSPSVFDRLEVRSTSMEKEVLPRLAEENELYCQHLEGYWMNVKKPRDFLQGQALYLAHLAKQRPEELASASASIEGHVKIDATAQIGEGCLIGPDVTIGPNCVLEEGVRLRRCVLLDSVRVGAHSAVSDSILGWRASTGNWARVEGVSVLGEDVHLAPEIFVNGALILPHKAISESVNEPKIIM